jgi:Flp pilus assembly protein TadG
MRTSKILELRKRTAVWRMPRSGAGERGDALVEMAILLPLLTLLLLGAFEVALAVYTSIEVSSAALAGAQYGAQNSTNAGDTTGIQNAATADAANITLGATTASESCICANGNSSTCKPTDCSGSYIETILTVQTQATFTPVVHFPGIPASFTFNGQAVEKVLQ